MTHRIVPAAALDLAQRRLAAPLAQAALQPYYAPLPPAVARDLIADAFLVEGDEVAGALVALDDDDRPCALVAGYPLGELAQRQQVALYHLASNLPGDAVGGFFAAARALAAEVPAVTGDGYYLARIGVAEAARGTGVAARLLARFLAEAGPRDAILHVHADNARAIAFYRRHGFGIADDARRYWLMRRPAA